MTYSKKWTKEHNREYQRRRRQDPEYCQLQRKRSQEYYAKNREEIAARVAAKRSNNPAIRERERLYEERVRDKRNAQSREKWREYRRQALFVLGGKCVRCGFDDWRALQIDHINGGGTHDRQSQSRNAFHKSIIAGKTQGYQLLCANCNWIKRAENHEV